MIEFRGVSLRYHYDEFELLKGVDFTLREGVNTVLADTQSGKSSICKLLLKEVKATGGELLVDGAKIDSIANASLGILYLPSAPVFFGGRSVAHNIEYPLIVRKIAKTERKKRVEEVAAALKIDFLGKKAKKLTAEERKLAALARGLTVERKVVLFDDFFAFDGLENPLESVKTVLNMFKNAICVIVTSDKRLAMGNATVLDGGVTVFQGDAEIAKTVVDGLGWIFASIEE